MKFQLYVIKGKENSGKTTTCWKLLNLFRAHSLIETYHYWKTSSSPTLHYEESDESYRIGKTHADFTTIFSIKLNNAQKKVAIISAGDDAEWLKKRICEMLGEGVSDIVCCERIVNRKGSTMEMLHSLFEKYIMYEESIAEPQNKEYEERIAGEIYTLLLK